MRILASFLVIIFLPFFMTKAEVPEPKYEIDSEYCNARYLFCLEYSDTLLPYKVIGDNGDGVILKSADAEMVMTVSGSRSVFGRDTRALYNDFVLTPMLNKGVSEIIYEIIDRDFYEVSFIDDSKYYFQKLMLRGNEFVILQITAPANEASQIDKVKNNMSLTFKM